MDGTTCVMKSNALFNLNFWLVKLKKKKDVYKVSIKP
jgi:hypothetical protein